MNRFGNTTKAIEYGNPAWESIAKRGLLNIAVNSVGTKLTTPDGHTFINMCSCSYLGLDSHPQVVAGAIAALNQAGAVNLSTSRLRIHLKMLDEVEDNLSELFSTKAVTAISCGAASAGMLPLIASGVFTDGERPVMAFDKNCHFSMNYMKAYCGDETEVKTCPHNDIDFLEDLCRHNKLAAYVADGAYSMGGHAPVKELLWLQDKYGLFLFFDDSHSLSAIGKRGEGYVRSQMGELSDRTIIVASLGKAFGACGGLVMLGPVKQRSLLERFGGPLGWSQCLNPAGVGAVTASAQIHRSPELAARQQSLAKNIAKFDEMIPTDNVGLPLPIRVVPMADAQVAARASELVYASGFYTSAVFFPIVARGEAGLRVMPRADLDLTDIERFCETAIAAQSLANN